MRQRLALLWLAVTAAIAGIASYFSYQAGWSQGIATKVPPGGAPYYWYGPHWGGGFFPFFGFFWFLVLLFLVFGVLRGFARMGRWGGGWRHEGRVPPPIEERLRDWHQKAHEEEAPNR